MANVIKHKRGSGSDPAANNLVLGELAIRTDTGKLFTKMDSGAIAEIAGGGSDIAINTLSSSSATGGGSATFNGSAYRFTLSAPPNVSAAQLLVSINGVIQKPVAGTGQPSEGFSVDGTDIILGDAPATGSDFFILTFKSLGVSEPADNSVTSAKIVDGAIVNADINASAAIAGSKISPSFTSDVTITGSSTSNLLIRASTLNGTAKLQLQDSLGRDNFIAVEGADNLVFAADEGNAGGDSYMRFKVDGSERLRIDSSGDVLIGTTTSSNSKLTVFGTDAAAIFQGSNTGTGSGQGFTVGNNGNVNSFVWNYENGFMHFATNNTERMRIDSSGRLLVGTTNTTTVGTVNKNLIVGSTTNAEEVAVTLNVMEGTNNRRVKFFLDDDDGVYGFDTTSSTGTAQFVVRHATSEKMRIDSSGRLMIGTSTQGDGLADNLTIADSGNCGLTIRGGSSSLSSIFFADGTGANGYVGQQVYNHADNSLKWIVNGSESLRIDSSGTVLLSGSKSGNSISDATLRFNIVNSNGDEKKAQIISTKVADVSSTIEFGTTVSHSYAERMRIHSNGFVGIGTAAPVRRLHLHNDSSTSNYLQVTNSTTGSSSTDGVLFGLNSSEDGLMWNFESKN